MKRVILLLFALSLIGCATTEKVIYRKIDKTVIIVPKTEQSKTITVKYSKTDATGKIVSQTEKDVVIPNIYYPDDDAVISSKSKWSEDVGADINTIEKKIK
jgi:hypothetical protein